MDIKTEITYVIKNENNNYFSPDEFEGGYPSFTDYSKSIFTSLEDAKETLYGDYGKKFKSIFEGCKIVKVVTTTTEEDAEEVHYE